MPFSTHTEAQAEITRRRVKPFVNRRQETVVIEDGRDREIVFNGQSGCDTLGSGSKTRKEKHS